MMPTACTAMSVAAAPYEQSDSSFSDCTDCLHCANHSKRRTRAGVRVSINLRQFFSDKRAHAFMWVPYGRCVQWLARRVARVFGLPDNIALMSRGHLLPAIEPLVMLDRDDPVEVVNMSFMLTPHKTQYDPNVTSLKSTNEISVLTEQEGANMHEVQSNVSIKQQNISQLLASGQGNNVVEHQNVSRLEYSLEDVETTMRSVENLSVDESKELQWVKERALRLLDDHCNMLQEASSPKRLRRRRRRRKPLVTNQGIETLNEEGPQPSKMKIIPQDAGAVVLHNDFGSRPPRLIRALSPSPILQYKL